MLLDVRETGLGGLRQQSCCGDSDHVLVLLYSGDVLLLPPPDSRLTIRHNTSAERLGPWISSGKREKDEKERWRNMRSKEGEMQQQRDEEKQSEREEEEEEAQEEEEEEEAQEEEEEEEEEEDDNDDNDDDDDDEGGGGEEERERDRQSRDRWSRRRKKG